MQNIVFSSSMPGLLKLWVAIANGVAKGNFGSRNKLAKQIGETNWLDKSDKNVFVNFTRKLKEGLH